MNEADKLLSRSFETLSAVAGEVITFRGEAVPCVINRVVVPDSSTKRHAGSYQDLDTQATSRIEVAVINLLTRPAVGEIAQDSRGIYHRIKKVTHAGLAWHLDCEVTEE